MVPCESSEEEGPRNKRSPNLSQTYSGYWVQGRTSDLYFSSLRHIIGIYILGSWIIPTLNP